MGIQGQTNLYGTLVTPGTANVKGNWEEVFVTTENIVALVISVIDLGGSGINNLFDIGIGSAGNEEVKIANLCAASGTQFNVGLWSIIVPVYIPIGTRIAIRAQSSGGIGGTITLGVQAIGGNLRNINSETYGAVTATSKPTTVDPGAVASTFGNWIELTPATGISIKYLVILITALGNLNHVSANFAIQIGTGAASSEVGLVETPSFDSNAFSDAFTCSAWYLPITVAQGTRIVARAASSITDATDRLVGVEVIGFTEVPLINTTVGNPFRTRLSAIRVQ